MSALDKLNSRAKKAEEKPASIEDKKLDVDKKVKNETVKSEADNQQKKLTEHVVERKHELDNAEAGEEKTKHGEADKVESVTMKRAKKETVFVETKANIASEPKKRGRPRLEEKCRFTIYLPESKENLLNLAMNATGKKANECIVEAACKYFEENKDNYESIIRLKEQLNL